MHKLKIRRIGQSFRVVLPEEVLARRHVTEALHGSCHLTSEDAEFAVQTAAAEEGMAAYRHALGELAE